MGKVIAPFTPEQVVYLEIWQAGIGVHPFTCGNDHEGDRDLIPTVSGWTCPQCDYTQDWCHDFMCEPRTEEPITSWVQLELAKQQLNAIGQMYQDWIVAKSLARDANPDVRTLTFRKEMFLLRNRINQYEFSSTGTTPSSKEDPSAPEGNGE